MAKIDELSAEIKKYIKSYNDILVGMHNDITKYKRDVNAQSAITKEALKVIETNLSEIHELRSETKENVQQISWFHKEIQEAAVSMKQGLAKFDSDKLSIDKSIDDLKAEISSHKEQFHLEVNALTKRIFRLYSVSLILFVLMFASMAYLFFEGL